VFDPERNTWAVRASLPAPRDHLATGTVSGKVYAIGGRLNGDYRRNLSVMEVYDPVTNLWARAADLPTARSGISASEVGGRLYAETARSVRMRRMIQHLVHGQTMLPMPTGRHGLGSAVVHGRIHVISGGPTPGGSMSDLHEVLYRLSSRLPSREIHLNNKTRRDNKRVLCGYRSRPQLSTTLATRLPSAPSYL